MLVHTKRSALKTAAWAGGTTTQLAIHPAGAEYQKFNFDFRISYATVEVDESTFTFMPGVTRHLMILEGTLEIDHTGRYAKRLNKFDVDVFDGEWPTTAKGRVMDFNLMTRGNAEGKLEAVLLGANEERKLELDQAAYTGMYLLKGKLKAGSIEMDEGDFVLIQKEPGVLLKAEAECEVIIARVKLNS